MEKVKSVKRPTCETVFISISKHPYFVSDANDCKEPSAFAEWGSCSVGCFMRPPAWRGFCQCQESYWITLWRTGEMLFLFF